MLNPRKIGRNDRCWCGSGIKYKKCHLNRSSQEPIKLWEAGKDFRDIFSFAICSSPTSFRKECSAQIIRAHTVPKSSSLKAIAKNGHVYGLKFTLENIRKYGGRLEPELIGVNQASTFTGFCKVHDNRIFEPIEKYEFKGTQKQCFLLAYRAFSRECYAKIAMSNLTSNLMPDLDKGCSEEAQQFIQIRSFLMNIGATSALKDNKFHKNRFDSMLESQSYGDCCAVIFEFNKPPPVMASGSVNPDFDFNGNRIQDLGDFEVVPDLLSMSSFYDGKKGFIVMTWLNYCSAAPQKLVKSLLDKPETELETYLVQYMFKNFENCFISPDWWETINAANKQAIIDLIIDRASLHSAPNDDGTVSVHLDIEFPIVQNKKFVNF